MSNLGKFINKFVSKEARKRGFAEVSIIQKWHEITPAHGNYTTPEKLFRGVLTIAVPSGSAKLAVQMDSPILIERINQFFGYEAVKKIRFILRQFEFEKKVAKKIEQPTDAARIRATARCANIKDLKFQEQMIKLGALIEMENVKHLKK
jgi:hypothetical protein